jgi:hypothetical protein
LNRDHQNRTRSATRQQNFNRAGGGGMRGGGGGIRR